jgi:hypothetical protein
MMFEGSSPTIPSSDSTSTKLASILLVSPINGLWYPCPCQTLCRHPRLGGRPGGKSTRDLGRLLQPFHAVESFPSIHWRQPILPSVHTIHACSPTPAGMVERSNFVARRACRGELKLHIQTPHPPTRQRGKSAVKAGHNVTGDHMKLCWSLLAH